MGKKIYYKAIGRGNSTIYIPKIKKEETLDEKIKRNMIALNKIFNKK